MESIILSIYTVYTLPKFTSYHWKCTKLTTNAHTACRSSAAPVIRSCIRFSCTRARSCSCFTAGDSSLFDPFRQIHRKGELPPLAPPSLGAELERVVFKFVGVLARGRVRSEERRVGKECRL